MIRITVAKRQCGNLARMSNIRAHASRKSRPTLTAAEQAAAVAAFLKSKGVTKCPTAFVVPTKGRVSENDRAALRRYAELQEERRLARLVQRAA